MTTTKQGVKMENQKTTIKNFRQKSFLDKWFSTYVRENGVVMTRRDWFHNLKIHSKKICIETYAAKKIHLEYKKLKTPKKSYLIICDGDFCYEVPKIIYDSLSIVETN